MKRKKPETLERRRILLGVTGSIAAYKALEIVRRLRALDADVIVIMTEAATKFVGPLSFETLSGNEVVKELFPAQKKVGTRHIDLASSSDLLVIAPATANILGKIACGIGDCILSTMAYAVRSPILFAPAMNKRLWDNPVVRENCRKLESLGHVMVGPEEGDLACGETGKGRMSEPEKVVAEVAKTLARRFDLSGKTILVSAGGTREYIDPVRFISNGSTGRMGFSIARAALNRGAKVHLVAGFTSVGRPSGVEFRFTKTAEDMNRAVLSILPRVDAVMMAAAVSDFQPQRSHSQKVKSKEMTLRLVRCPDILMHIARKKKKGTYVVGFSLETKDNIERAKSKLRKKDLDMIVSNAPDAMGSEQARVTLILRKGDIEVLPLLSKDEVADRILDRVKNSIG
ncbi:bifunctional phosphopantothenoylcysteine decarboxylase/phosphopantothenate--cysteine ligase CoaBC [candidate division TA06 bacterium]|uniref:Coenzyme A biosynthesis bifunctional protein CoaBC n=1 Tax=candidate division TA06 bacterium TaxID=2250710 RepID=A0A523UR68_UNCT6|nr:MAG: bifunctional phosphopantothenoylcysteine decarboxylase/phosphopantothenate--cysteine ligase CoaBC [candidate division TA06 bacterium]